MFGIFFIREKPALRAGLIIQFCGLFLDYFGIIMVKSWGLFFNELWVIFGLLWFYFKFLGLFLVYNEIMFLS